MPGRFHLMQVYVAAGLGGLMAVLYLLAPEAKSDLLGGAVMTLIGFVVGKFSNGYGKKDVRAGGSEEGEGR
jgi:uncharacterized BrkB/YihY/UPF0761 family membrane protein